MKVVWALGFMGAVGLFGAIGLFSQAWRARRGIVVPGTVVAIERRRMSSAGRAGMRSYTYAPVVEYTDRSGGVHRVSAGLSGTRRPEVGSTVQFLGLRPRKCTLASRAAARPALIASLPGR